MCVSVGCTEEEAPPPKSLIGRDSMILILKDIQLVEARYQRRILARGERLRDQTMQNYAALFEAHGISESRFRSSYVYYQREPEELEVMFDEVIELLTTEQAAIQKQVPSTEQVTPSKSKMKAMSGLNGADSGNTLQYQQPTD